MTENSSFTSGSLDVSRRGAALLHQIRWTSEKIRQRLMLIEPLVYRRRHPLAPFRYLRLEGPHVSPPAPSAGDTDTWTAIPWGSYWGGYNADFVLRGQFQAPAGWDGGAPTALHLPIGAAGDFSHPEALVYIDGRPYAACDRHHQEVILASDHADGNPHALMLHGWTGWLNGDPDAQLLMRPCALVQIDQPTRDLIALARVSLGVADSLSEDNPTRAHLYNALDEAFRVLDTREPWDERFYDSVPAAHQTLQQGIERAGPPLEVDITAAGHAHIDVAWLWTLAQTRRKAGRTFHNVLRLMDQFPGFRFTQSQPQLYDFVRQDYPELFQAIRKRVRDGRWEPVGGMWVEADCNLSGGESLARQFLLGRTFFDRHFGQGAESPVLWLPDVFGYAWNLPQLIKEAGLDYFFTIKIGWSQYNRLPYDSFWWQGLDGTRVLTHFSTTKDSASAHAATYNAAATPDQVMTTWTNFQQKDWGRPGLIPPLLMSFGYGDGGGGPTREMLENIRELEAFPAAPRTHFGTVKEFFVRLQADVGDSLPTWNGELYLEFHRGTYTTQARNKRANRKSEFLLHDAEFLAALAAALDPAYRYPHQGLRQAWELVCLNQFHDIIPGSSIGPVYAESLQQYAQVHELGETVREEALATVIQHTGGDLLVVNATSFQRVDLAFWREPAASHLSVTRADGSPVPIQKVDGGWLLQPGELAPYSVTPLFLESVRQEPDRSSGLPSPTGLGDLIATPGSLENEVLRVELDAAGDIVRITDKRDRREVLPTGAIANQFQAFEDRPKTPDAWEVDIYYDDRMWTADPAESIEVVENGPLRVALEVRRRLLNSEIVQRISLAAGSARIDFDTTVQWHERHIMLKAAFPVDVLSPIATHEIQWGNVQRPTHRNTSWDWARFETCAHKWVDLSEGGYGVSLLNDCKYGHDIRDNVIRLTLLRSPTFPDPEADCGQHQFTYSLLPHRGSWDETTASEAYALNDPLLVWTPSRSGQANAPPSGRAHGEAFVRVDPSNVIVETIKQAEDGRGIIVRLYEYQRRRGNCTLFTGFPLAAAWRTDLLENDQEELRCAERSVTIQIKPYQIVTLRLLPRENL
jgi:alpha-mannosidase